MKKLSLVIIGALSVCSAAAQFNGNHSTYRAGDPVPKNRNARQHMAAHHTGAKTTTVTIASENFGTGTNATLPTGWTAGIINGSGTWRWTDTASTSANSMGAMLSTTAANGWMIFDADSIQNDCGCAPAGWLQSPLYNCSGHATVRLNFEEFFGNVQDTCQVWVSTDPTFATYTVYPLTLNDGIAFGSETANTALIHLNISATAAGQPAVYVRYVYYGEEFLELSWMVDDMSLTELDPHDAGISGAFMLAPDASAYNGSVFNTPLAFIDSFVPGAMLSNYGANAETGLVSTARIYNGTTNVYTQNNTYPSLPVNAVDSPVWYPAYKPTATGSYTCALNTMLAGDADATNDRDTVLFNITDTTWMQNDTVVATNFFMNITPGTFGIVNGESSVLGTRFDVPSSAVGDTISGFGVAFSPLSGIPPPGHKISVQLYSIHRGDSSWHYVATSVARPITAADTSSFAYIKWADFRIDTGASGGITPFILQPGTSYAAVVQMYHVTTNLLLFASEVPPIPGMNGSFAVSDTSDNDGLPSTRLLASDTGISGMIPFIRMYFGTVPVDHTSVKNITLAGQVGTAYPDPANAIVTIPFIATIDAQVKVTLSNIAGQIVGTKYVHAIGGAPASVTFATGSLAEGIYNYDVMINDGHEGGRIAIAH